MTTNQVISLLSPQIFYSVENKIQSVLQRSDRPSRGGSWYLLLQREKDFLLGYSPNGCNRQIEARNQELQPGFSHGYRHKYFGHLRLLSQAYWQGTGSQVEQLGLELLPVLDALCCKEFLALLHTMPGLFFFFLNYHLSVTFKKTYSG